MESHSSLSLPPSRYQSGLRTHHPSSLLPTTTPPSLHTECDTKQLVRYQRLTTTNNTEETLQHPDLDSAPPRGRPQPAAVLHDGPPNAQPQPVQMAQAAVPVVSQLYPDLDLPAAEGEDSPPAYSTPWLSVIHTANSGLEKPNAMGRQNPIIPWEAHLRDRFIHGIKPEISEMVQTSCITWESATLEKRSYRWHSWQLIKHKSAGKGEVDGGEEDEEELTLALNAEKWGIGRESAL
ncbi:unnamed protein product [Pleuronectes platessa]|uniref:Uncharacterized protein n=1 Tax=Pleuronectes platessa TaxID=8262 RepID=A0A9N7YKQ9_PLEPL|nr:unnamed protein product [Pleuronectes platessa]